MSENIYQINFNYTKTAHLPENGEDELSPEYCNDILRKCKEQVDNFTAAMLTPTGGGDQSDNNDSSDSYTVGSTVSDYADASNTGDAGDKDNNLKDNRGTGNKDEKVNKRKKRKRQNEREESDTSDSLFPPKKRHDEDLSKSKPSWGGCIKKYCKRCRKYVSN